MKTNQISKLIHNMDTISNVDISDLDKLLLKYPYFQSGQLLLTKALLENNSIRYNQQLKKAACYSQDRKRLFNLINLIKRPKEKKKGINTSASIEQKLELKKPLRFDENEMHSFSEWLSVIKIKKIKREDKTLIDNFLQKKATINTAKKHAFFKPINIAKESLIENSNLITPTLAKVYLEQEHYEKAISAYEKLILKYPKKSSFFAAQIKLIRQLNKK